MIAILQVLLNLQEWDSDTFSSLPLLTKQGFALVGTLIDKMLWNDSEDGDSDTDW